MPKMRSLDQEIDALGPWCHEIEVVEGVSTRGWYERTDDRDPLISFIDPKATAVGTTVPLLFPDGLGGRSVLDCGCNAGGYLFHVRELGAGRCLGFDAREHWIRQARFVARCRGYDDMAFEVCDLHEFDAEPFEVTFFNSLLYHLPDPITGLKIAADLTREVIFVDTATRAGMPDGYLAIENESEELLLSGIHGLNWLPTGPDVLDRMLEWVGFVESRVISNFPVREDVGRMAMVASKIPGRLAHVPDLRDTQRG
jgi:SAM-dependent methyltransferase